MLIFFFPIVLRNILAISLLTRNTRIKLALAIPTDVLMTAVNKQRKALLFDPDSLVSIFDCCDILIGFFCH